MTLCPILEICDRETGYKGRGRRQGPWWWKTVARKQLSNTLKVIVAAARERRWKSSKRVGGGVGRDAAELEDGAGSDGSWGAGTETGDAQVCE